MDSSKKPLDDLRGHLNEATDSYKRVLQQTHNEALAQNELQTKRWQDYQFEHKELSARLLLLRDKLSHQIMVPLGKKALLRGNLVHTNEILVCLGGSWFAKQSANQAADICQRRIQNCEEMLENLQKERELLMSRKSFTFESEAFNADQTQEIIEPYDEEAEKQWRENHRKKQKEYHQKLAELKKNQKTKIETEEDLWSRLDALDLQEELEDELNRLNEDEEDDSEESEDEDTSDDDKESDAEHSDKKTKNVKHAVLKRRVSFKEDGENNDTEKKYDNDENDDMIHIHFKHSKVPLNELLDPGDDITNPADIYTRYIRQRRPKSILKPSSSADTLSNSEATENSANYFSHEEEAKVLPGVPTEPVIQAVGEVVEHTPNTSTAETSERPVSRFKAARKANKR